jgi:hypothetical protein
VERHIGRTFIIPVIIFIYGLWQYSRVSGLAKLAFYFQDNTVIFRYGMTCLGIVFAVLAAVTIGYAMVVSFQRARFPKVAGYINCEIYPLPTTVAIFNGGKWYFVGAVVNIGCPK